MTGNYRTPALKGPKIALHVSMSFQENQGELAVFLLINDLTPFLDDVVEAHATEYIEPERY